MLRSNCLCLSKELKIYSTHVYNYLKHEETGSRIWFERIENTFIDVYFGYFRMFSTNPYCFTEMSYFKSVIDTFLSEKMGFMSKSDPYSLKRFEIGDGIRGILLFSKQTRTLSENKYEQFLRITHIYPPKPINNETKTSLTYLSVDYDIQEVKHINSCLGKALSIYDTKVIHPQNEKEMIEKYSPGEIFEDDISGNVLINPHYYESN